MAKNNWPDWEVYVRDRCVCVYCGFDGRTLQSWYQLAIDHLVPRSAKGPDTPDNKVVSCISCNMAKGQIDPRKQISEKIQFPLSDSERAKLIAAAQSYIGCKIGQGDPADFELMMEEIRDRYRADKC